jgi:light-regulated signal transduction histidine kinase (bacteriophytochrome)
VARLAALAAREMKRLTGFGRCLVYRFDEAGHGEVLAEEVEPGYDSYTGHRFPASDIPQQARALYLVNHIRLIADANYRPVPLLANDASLTAAASTCRSRSCAASRRSTWSTCATWARWRPCRCRSWSAAGCGA